MAITVVDRLERIEINQADLQQIRRAFACPAGV
jgi:hypothetical protein